MIKSEIYDTLREIFYEIFLREIPLSPQLTARDVPGWDSFKHIEIVLAAEERFGIKFSTREIDALRSVDDLASLISNKKGYTS